MEIERKYLISRLPGDLAEYPSHRIEQAYLCTAPVIRIRRQDEAYILTCKGEGLMCREELNLPMSPASYEKLLPKAEGTIITKRRYLLPLPEGCLPKGCGGNLTIELDVFTGDWAGLVIAEVEFPDEDTARQFTPPGWFGRDVTFDGRYHNSYLSSHTAI